MPDRDPTFAPAVSDLHKSALGNLGVTSDPAPGQGFSLDEKGRTPAVVQGGVWNMEIVAVVVDIGNTAGHAGGNMNVTIPGLQVGDYCFLVGSLNDTRLFVKTTRGLCATENVIVLDFFNTSASTDDPDSETFYFLVIHRHLV